MSYRPKGKHVRITPSSPEALGMCDYTQMVFNRSDLVKQMEWRGDAIQWTGFYVGRPYADVPNAQLRPDILPPDPIPVMEPRLRQGQIETYSNNTLGIFSEIELAINTIDTLEDGNMCLSEADRLTALQNVYFGGL